MLKLSNTSPLVSAPPQCEMKTKPETGAGQRAGQGAGQRGGRRGGRLLGVLLHEAVDLEPVGSPAVSGARLGHPHHQTFSQSAGFTGSSVLLVHNTSVVILTFSYHRLIVTSPAEKRFAALAGEGSEVEASSRFITDPTELVLHWVHLVELERYNTLD